MSGGSFPKNDQFGPAVRGSECLGNGAGGGGRTAHPMDSRKDGLLRKSRHTHDLSDGSAGCCEDVVSECHTPKGKNVLTNVKRRILMEGKENVYHWRMERSQTSDPWPQREHSRHLLDIWLAEETTRTKASFAEACEMTSGAPGVKQYYSGKQIPGRNLATKFAKTKIRPHPIPPLHPAPAGFFVAPKIFS